MKYSAVTKSLDNISYRSTDGVLNILGLTNDEITQLQNINSSTISNTQWGYLGDFDQSLMTTDTVRFNTVELQGSNHKVSYNAGLDGVIVSGFQGVRLSRTAGTIADFTSSGMNLTGDITVSGTVDGRDIAADGLSLDNLNTTIGLSALTSAEVDQLENINTTTISTTQWGYLGALNQGLTTTSNVSFNKINLETTGDVFTFTGATNGFINNLATEIRIKSKENTGHTLYIEPDTANNLSLKAGSTGGSVLVGADINLTGNITVSGTVDGRDVSADGSNLDNLYSTIGLSALTSAEVDQLENIGTATISSTQWGYLGDFDQSLMTTDNVRFNKVEYQGANHYIKYNSTVDGVGINGFAGVRVMTVSETNTVADFLTNEIKLEKPSSIRTTSSSAFKVQTAGGTSDIVSVDSSSRYLSLHDSLLRLRNDNNHYIAYDSTPDGIDIMGYNGIRLGTLNGGLSSKISISSSVIDLNTDTDLNGFKLFLKSSGDTNHALRYSGTGTEFNSINVDGPALYGFANGLLGIKQGGIETHALVWSNTQVNTYLNTRINNTLGVVSGHYLECLDTTASTSSTTGCARFSGGIHIAGNSLVEAKLEIKKNVADALKCTDGTNEVFRVDLSGLNIKSYTHLPNSDDTYDLGSSSVKWRNIYSNRVFIEAAAPGLSLTPTTSGAANAIYFYTNDDQSQSVAGDLWTIGSNDTYLDRDFYIRTNSTGDIMSMTQTGVISVPNTEASTGTGSGAIRCSGGLLALNRSYFSKGGAYTDAARFNGHATPDTDASFDLGSGALQWRDIFLVNAPTVSSDKTLKKEIEEVSLPIENFMKTKIRKYKYDFENKNDRPRLGVLAQELNWLREFNVVNLLNGKLNLKPTELIYVLWNIIQQLIEKNKLKY